MSVAFDATFLLYLFAPPGQVAVPLDDSGSPIKHVPERVQLLFDDIEKAGTTIIVPTPALSEIFVRAGVETGQEWVRIMKRAKIFRISPFDEVAAAEAAIMVGNAKKCPVITPQSEGTWAKIKYDKQIVAIAVSQGAKTFYTDDINQGNFARRYGLQVIGVGDCPLPPSVAQLTLALGNG